MTHLTVPQFRLRHLLGLCSASALAWVCLSASRPAPAQDEPADSPLHSAMEGLQGGMRGLRKQLETPSESANAQSTLQQMLAHAQVAFANPPAPAAGSAEKDTALWNIAFRRQILDVTKTLLDLEQALLEGKTDEVKAAFAKLNELKKLGHDQFQIEDH